MQRSLRLLLLVAATFASLVLGCSDELAPIAGDSNSEPAALAPLLSSVPGAEYVDGSYIVVMKDTVAVVDRAVEAMGRKYNCKSEYRYANAIKGFAGPLSASALDALRRDPRVSYIERNQVAHVVTTELNPTWGLDRIDQRARPLNAGYVYNQTGVGVDAYIIDTGIRLTHADFAGRAVVGYDAVTSGGTASDGNGHGTHVAGTIGGTTYGVAKGVRLIAVRVLDNSGSGSYAQIIAGVDWVTANHTTRPAVANMSLGGPASTALDAAIRRSISDGITYCIAAGNSSVDATAESPARVAEAITVGATDVQDVFARFSNYGSLVDVLAPGVNVTSDWCTSNTATVALSGTSMAAPHVAGVAALYLETHPTAKPAAVWTALSSASTLNVISGLPSGTPNRLLYSLFAAPPPPPPPLPAAPILQSPGNDAAGVARPTTLSWRAASGATSYRIQVSTSAALTPLVYDNAGITSTSTVVSTLGGKTYYWRVNATNASGTGAWSGTWKFKTR